MWLAGKSLSSALQLQDNLLAARGELNTYKPRLPRGFKDWSHLAGIMNDPRPGVLTKINIWYDL